MHSLDFRTQRWYFKPSPRPPLSHLTLDDIKCLPSFKIDDGKGGAWTDWEECVQGVPGTVHVELLGKGRILDPFKGRNESSVQWVGETDWIYHCTFPSPPLPHKNEHSLRFDGLDTFCSVYLNDHLILESDNQFISHRVDATEFMNGTDQNNDLYLVFRSAFVKGRQIEEEHLGEGNHSFLWNGDPARVWVRKSGTNWGWDWGPVLMTAGPWRPIFLETFAIKITDLYAKPIVDHDLMCSLSVSFSLLSSPTSFSVVSTKNITTQVDLVDPRSLQIIRSITTLIDNVDDVTVDLGLFSEDEIQLWWAIGQKDTREEVGRLYTVRVTVCTPEDTVVEEQKIGFRRLRLIQEPLEGETGSSFYFEVNNQPIFAGGSNWIPCDNFLSNVSKERYDDWLEMIAKGNQNMVRVWGGGVYEDDCFYDGCDEKGILLWQDFMFGCGQYPGFSQFIQSVKKEAENNVKRLRHHACLAIFAGNNEDYQIAEAYNLEYDPSDTTGDYTKTTFPAREIYERVLPGVVKELTKPGVYYHPGSPWGGKDTRDPTVGDIHQWNVWHGSQQRYQDWDQLGGRFVSEFGMEGYPHPKTIDYFLDGKIEERFPQSATMCDHNKAAGFERRLELYLVENFRHSFDMDDYIYFTQLMQSEALSTAYRLWRRNFKGEKKYYTAGALVWQIDDCWPTISWAICDYFLRPKPAYFTIKRALEPVAIGMKRYTKKIFPSKWSASFEEKEFVEIWGVNSNNTPQTLNLRVQAFHMLTGEKIMEKTEQVTLPPIGSIDLNKIEPPKSPVNQTVVVAAQLLGKDEQVVSRFAVWPEPFKYLTFPLPDTTGLQVVTDHDNGLLHISATVPIKGLVLYCNDEMHLGDNGLDVTPGDTQTVRFTKGLTGRRITWRYLGDDQQRCP